MNSNRKNIQIEGCYFSKAQIKDLLESYDQMVDILNKNDDIVNDPDSTEEPMNPLSYAHLIGRVEQLEYILTNIAHIKKDMLRGR